jgi:hypothetical protein
MKLWRLWNFDTGPHWDAALVRAETEDKAKAILASWIAEDEDTRPSEVWELKPLDEWRIALQADATPVVFVLGAGCRG